MAASNLTSLRDGEDLVMRVMSLVNVVILTALVSMAAPESGGAQVGALRRRAEEEARKRLEAAAKKAGEDSTKKAAEDSTKKEAAKKAADSAATKSAGTPSTPNSQPAAAGAQAAPTRVDPKVWENYDFVPGSKVLFYTDFSEDRVGNFARGLKYASGPAEVVERDGVKMLRATARSEFLIPVGKRLPERFTLEIDVITPGTRANEAVSIEGGSTMDRSAGSANLLWNPLGALYLGSGGNAANSPVRFPDDVSATLIGKVAHLRVLMDSGYFKMFVNERRIYNRPDFMFKRDSVIRVTVDAREEDESPIFVTSIRVAESETDVLYDALAAKGRWATHGILFATGKADLQPESRAVLKDIAATLKQHADLKILIEGHTDNVGAAASNLSLSDARAAAVKAALVADYAVDGSRITTKGLGDTKPAVPNTSASGRAQNRRVEVVKQ
jgi:outer membrane protein OmpA-like peptidoglycan-associated protein